MHHRCGRIEPVFRVIVTAAASGWEAHQAGPSIAAAPFGARSAGCAQWRPAQVPRRGESTTFCARKDWRSGGVRAATCRPSG